MPITPAPATLQQCRSLQHVSVAGTLHAEPPHMVLSQPPAGEPAAKCGETPACIGLPLTIGCHGLRQADQLVLLDVAQQQEHGDAARVAVPHVHPRRVLIQEDHDGCEVGDPADNWAMLLILKQQRLHEQGHMRCKERCTKWFSSKRRCSIGKLCRAVPRATPGQARRHAQLARSVATATPLPAALNATTCHCTPPALCLTCECCMRLRHPLFPMLFILVKMEIRVQCKFLL